MSFEKRLCAAVRSVIPEAAPNVYEGNAEIFATWNYNERGTLFSDSEPEIVIYLVQVHVFLPRGYPWREIKRKMRAILSQLGTYPSIEDASDEEGEHLVFEFEAMDGDV